MPEGNISKMSKMSDCDVFSLLNVRNVMLDLMVNEKTAKFSGKYVQKKTHQNFSMDPPPKKACNSIQKMLHFCKAVVLYITNTE